MQLLTPSKMPQCMQLFAADHAPSQLLLCTPGLSGATPGCSMGKQRHIYHRLCSSWNPKLLISWCPNTQAVDCAASAFRGGLLPLQELLCMMEQHLSGAVSPKRQSKVAKLTQAICDQYWHYGHPGTPVLQLQACFAILQEDMLRLDAV